jgi:hypothetical protein
MINVRKSKEKIIHLEKVAMILMKILVGED